MASLPWRLVTSATAIQPVIVGANEAALALADGLWRRGFYVPAIRPPTVPPGSARLRVSLSAAHTAEDVDNLLAALAALAPACARGDLG
jgi:8-amino-7-oxononanoate synthase